MQLFPPLRRQKSKCHDCFDSKTDSRLPEAWGAVGKRVGTEEVELVVVVVAEAEEGGERSLTVKVFNGKNTQLTGLVLYFPSQRQQDEWRPQLVQRDEGKCCCQRDNILPSPLVAEEEGFKLYVDSERRSHAGSSVFVDFFFFLRRWMPLASLVPLSITFRS